MNIGDAKKTVKEELVSLRKREEKLSGMSNAEKEVCLLQLAHKRVAAHGMVNAAKVAISECTKEFTGIMNEYGCRTDTPGIKARITENQAKDKELHEYKNLAINLRAAIDHRILLLKRELEENLVA
jgi:hypothetical protein